MDVVHATFLVDDFNAVVPGDRVVEILECLNDLIIVEHVLTVLDNDDEVISQRIYGIRRFVQFLHF